MIKAVDREKWITVSKIAVPLKVCTAVAADIAGTSVVPEALDPVFDNKYLGKRQR